jgi:hypothetical protein
MLVFCPHSVFWTKSLVCKDASQGFYYSEILQSQNIFSTLSAVRTIETSRPDAHLSLFHPSGRRAILSGLQTDQASSIRTTCLSVRTLHCVEKVLSILHPSRRFSSTFERSQYSNSLRFFPSSNKLKIDQPSGQCGIPSGCASP